MLLLVVSNVKNEIDCAANFVVLKVESEDNENEKNTKMWYVIITNAQ
jgi:hypothetical protein